MKGLFPAKFGVLVLGSVVVLSSSVLGDPKREVTVVVRDKAAMDAEFQQIMAMNWENLGFDHQQAGEVISQEQQEEVIQVQGDDVVVKETTTIETHELSLSSSLMRTDRPYQSISPFIMETGRVQIESGYVYEDQNNGGHQISNIAPQFMVRYGLNSDWELRAGWDGYSFNRGGEDIANSSFIGFKHHLSDQTKDMPEFAWVTKLNLPTGNAAHNDVDPQSLLAWNFKVDERINIFGNTGIGSPTDPVTGDRFFQGLTSIGTSYKINDQWTVFGEGYTNFPAADDEDAESILQTGAKYLINNHLQLDTKFGIGINEQSPDFVFGLGVSGRI